MRTRGATLVEVMVAFLVLSVATLSMAGMLRAALNGHLRFIELQAAHRLLQDAHELLVLTPKAVLTVLPTPVAQACDLPGSCSAEMWFAAEYADLIARAAALPEGELTLQLQAPAASTAVVDIEVTWLAADSTRRSVRATHRVSEP